MRTNRRHRSGALFLISVIAGAAQAAGNEPPASLPATVVIGAPLPNAAPASIDAVKASAVPVATQRSISELLQHVAGVAARDRQNLAQDMQLTIRGFGARSTFGVRGLRIYADGIPASMPDGQGQVSHVPLAALESVEVLRGPFSALYGNASGGVIQFFSKPPAPTPTFGLGTALGGNGLRMVDLAASGPWLHGTATPEAGYRLDAGRLDTDGYREHSRARREIAQARLTLVPDSDTRVALTANTLDLDAQDPQGLSLEQARANPRAASSGALAFDTRKSVRQSQMGVRLQRNLGHTSRMALGLHAGQRRTWQMLSIPIAAQRAPGSGGGVVDLDRNHAGLDARWSLDLPLAGRPLALTLGTELQRADENRLGFENFVGEKPGVVGRLRRDQRDRSNARDGFTEVHWRFAPRWQASAGLRRSTIHFDSRDHYIAAGNPDDSGRMSYAFTSPVAGLLFEPVAGVGVHLNAGRGFETPSTAELAYRPDDGSGLNDALRPSRSDSVEAGLRLLGHERRLALTVFNSSTRDELVVASNQGGRSTYRNAARTTRRGWELSASGALRSNWRYALRQAI